MADEVLNPIRPRCSPQRIEANRRNAKLSTGPKTAAGKKAVSQNAYKHGLTAMTAIVEKYENPDQFRKLFGDLCESYAPVGAIEFELVEEIALCIWRRRRARSAEASAIHETTKTEAKRLIMKSALDDPPVIKAFCLRVPIEDRVDRLKNVIDQLGEICEQFNQTQQLDERSRFILGDFRDCDELIRLSEDDPTTFTRALRNRLQMLHTSFNIAIPLGPALLPVPDTQLPEDSSLDKILRYETTINRRMYQAMNHLERLQRQREGEHIPAPIAWA